MQNTRKVFNSMMIDTQLSLISICQLKHKYDLNVYAGSDLKVLHYYISYQFKMSQLLGKMRELSIREMKLRREEIFQRTRKIMMADSDEQESFQETENNMSSAIEEPMEEETPYLSNKKKKKKELNNRIRRFWRKTLQVNDWMLEVPDNLPQFYVAARPDGNKCLAVFRDYSMELRDKSGSLILQSQLKSKINDNSVFEAFYIPERKILVFSDLIAWKGNPMTSSEFQFRCAWLVSNLNINNISAWTGLSTFFINYFHCDIEGLKQAYAGQLLYQREGLIFVHKDSFYLHGFNPNVLVWKDITISKYLQSEIQESKNGCKGIGFLNKKGEIKTIENVTLFTINRQNFDESHRFLKFSYTNIIIQNIEQKEEIKVNTLFENLKIIDTLRNYNGPIDSLGKLLYKCKIKQSTASIEQIAKRCNNTEMKS